MTALHQSHFVCDAPVPGAKSHARRASERGPERPASTSEALRFPPDFLAKASDRFKLRHRIAQMLRNPDTGRGPCVCGCGRSAFGADGEPIAEVTVTRTEEGRIGVGRVFRCGSCWLCPVCAPSQTIERQKRVAAAVAALYKKKGVAVMVTLTVRHGVRDRLSDLKEIVQTAGRKARQGRAWVAAQKTVGIVGTIVAPEVTYSLKHGWHFHLHLLVLCKTDSLCAASTAGELLVGRYIENVKAAGARAWRLSQDVQIATSPQNAADYIAKGLAWELSGRTQKASRSAKGLTPFEIAAAAAAGDKTAFALFREYAEAVAGTRSCIISKSLSDALDLEAAAAAPMAEEQQFGAEGDIVGSLSSATWNGLMRLGRASELVEKVEKSQPWDEIVAWAQSAAHPPPPAAPPPPRHEPDYARVGRVAAGWGSGSTARGLRYAIAAERREVESRGHEFTLDIGRLQAAVVAAATKSGCKPAMCGLTTRTLAKGSLTPVEPQTPVGVGAAGAAP